MTGHGITKIDTVHVTGDRDPEIVKPKRLTDDFLLNAAKQVSPLNEAATKIRLKSNWKRCGEQVEVKRRTEKWIELDEDIERRLVRRREATSRRG